MEHDMAWVKANGLGFLVADTARLLRKRFDKRAREIGMTRAQWQVIAHLAMNEGINQAGLADLLEIQPITLSRQLDKLEEGGWVIRRPDPSDRRARVLELTGQASGLLSKIRGVGRSLVDDVTAGLTPEHVEQVRAGLQHMRAALSDRPGDSAEPTEMKLVKRAVR